MRRLVIGDIHSGYRAMKQVLERADFNKDKDLLIGLGDYVDGWPDAPETVDFLMNLPNFKGVLGNHDNYLLDFLRDGYASSSWVRQGGEITKFKYLYSDLGIEKKDEHRDFLANLPHSLVIDNKLFVHGGVLFNKDGINLEGTDESFLMWDRDLFFQASSVPFSNTSPFDEVYIGHTTTEMVSHSFSPISSGNVFLLDQGGGWSGKLTVMDIDTHSYWQSDLVYTLYPEIKGRN